MEIFWMKFSFKYGDMYTNLLIQCTLQASNASDFHPNVRFEK